MPTNQTYHIEYDVYSSNKFDEINRRRCIRLRDLISLKLYFFMFKKNKQTNSKNQSIQIEQKTKNKTHTYYNHQMLFVILMQIILIQFRDQLEQFPILLYIKKRKLFFFPQVSSSSSSQSTIKM